MKIESWQEFYDSLQIDDFYGSDSPQKPSGAMLAELDVAVQVPPPAIFVVYTGLYSCIRTRRAWVFIAESASARVPRVRRHSGTLRSAVTNTCLTDCCNLAIVEADLKPRLERLFIFAVKNNEDFIGWDPIESSADGEYAIYRVKPQLEIEFLAPSFRQLIENFWDEAQNDPDWDEDERGTREQSFDQPIHELTYSKVARAQPSGI